MKNSKFLLFLASLNIAGSIFKILFGFNGGYLIPQGWMNGIILDIWSGYIFTISDVKRKWIYLMYGAIVSLAIACALATLSMFGLVYAG